MKKRIITGTVLVAILFLFVLLRELVSVYVFDVFILVASTYAAYEISLCVQKAQNSSDKKLLYAAPLFSALTFILFISLQATGNIGFFLPFEAVLFAAFILFVYFACTRVSVSPRLNIFALVYPSALFMFFYLANHIADYYVDIPNKLGLFAIVLTFAISSFTDTFAMFSGKILQGPKLCPKISPKKTISGFVGGLVFGMIAAIFTFVIFNSFQTFKTIFSDAGVTALTFVPVGLVMSALSQAGDIYESAFKRRIGIKDTGTIFPGHGGIMDRLDGVCFVVAGVFLSFLIMFV